MAWQALLLSTTSFHRRLSATCSSAGNQCPACESPRLYELDLLSLRHPIEGSRTGFVSGCDECGLVFRNPLPTPEEQDRFYSPDGEWGSPRKELAARVPEPEDKRGKSWSWPFEAIRGELSVTSPPPGAKVLDFGCADGKLLERGSWRIP